MTHNALGIELIKAANVRNALTYTGAIAGGLMGKAMSPITMGPDHGDSESEKRKALNEVAHVAAGAVLGIIAARGGMSVLRRM